MATRQEEALVAAAIAISGAPFPTSRSLKKADAAIAAYLSALGVDHVELAERLEHIASAEDGSSLGAKQALREAAVALSLFTRAGPR